MKRASEIASLMQEAREADIDKQRESEQDSDRASKLKTEEDRLHLAFEAQALNAARKRELHIYWNGEPLNHERLKKQGLMVRNLVLRESFEEHLRRLKNDSHLNIIRAADKLIEKFPGLAIIDGDNLLHRNPIISLIKTKINNGEINSNTSNELFCAWLRIHSGASKEELERNVERISQLLEQYKEFLRISQKLKEIADENSMVPENSESATLIDWDDALADANHEKSFSAGRLKWIARCWPSLKDDLESHLEAAAKQGRNHKKFLFLSGESTGTA